MSVSPWRRRMPGIVLLVAASAVGCASRGALLPEDEEVNGRFESFEEARDAFLAIEHGKTTADELRALQIDPATQGTELFSYPRAHQALFFHRGVDLDVYGPAVKRCLQARQRCEVWRVEQTQTRRKRTTSLLADLLRFHRRRHTTGWDFDGVVLVLDGVAVYSLWGGLPHISEIDQSIRPLSYLQGDVSFRVPPLGTRPVIFFETPVDFDAELEGRNR